MKILFYIVLFAFAYKVLKKLFSPALNNANNQHNQQQKQQHTTFNTPPTDRSNVVEDIDYEEVE